MDSTFDRIHCQNKVYPYAMGHEQFVEQLAEHFPRERENLVRLRRQTTRGRRADQYRPPRARRTGRGGNEAFRNFGRRVDRRNYTRQ